MDIKQLISKYSEFLHHEDPTVRQFSEIVLSDLNSISMQYSEISKASDRFDGMGHGVEAFKEGAEWAMEKLGAQISNYEQIP